MIVAIHQPQYLPWLGYFDKLRQADIFCFLDNVQYKKNEWQNRNQIKTAQNRQWLTVPVLYRYPQKINTVPINNTVDWKHKHLQALITNYGKAPFFKDVIGCFESVYAQDWRFLSPLNIHLVERLCRMMKINTRTISASGLNVSEDPTDRLIDICKSVGGDIYLSGPDGAKYLNLDRCKERGLTVRFHRFNHPVYPQRYGSFQSHLSVVDLVFNCGPESLRVIESGGFF